MRREIFANGEYYHIYNRGVDHRNIVEDSKDADRFVKCIDVFNSVEPIGSLYALSFAPLKLKSKKLVDVVVYCLNPNHFHFILKQKVSGGISEFMHRLSGGHSWYFNKKYKRGGSLYQGKFKAKHIKDNSYLLHLSTYINLNNNVHQLSGRAAKLVRSSWNEYTTGNKGLCSRGVVLDQFKSCSEYAQFTINNLPEMLSKREGYRELKDLMFD